MNRGWSSFENDKLIMESWRDYLQESREPERLDEAIFTTAALVGLLYKFLSNRQNAMKILQAFLRRKDVSPEVKTVFKKLENILVMVDTDAELEELRLVVDKLNKISPKQWAIDKSIDYVVTQINPTDDPAAPGPPPTPRKPSSDAPRPAPTRQLSRKQLAALAMKARSRRQHGSGERVGTVVRGAKALPAKTRE